MTFVTEQLPGDGDRRTLRFTVSDTGIGIDPAFLPRLFDPFSREDFSTTNRFGGSGLGLAIAYRIARLMGGDIAVKSEKDAGSAFTMTVALGAVERPALSCDAPAGSIWSDVSLEGRSVLIAEDIDMNAEIIADLMDMEGVRTDRAENGRIAVERFAESPVNGYDAILMDLRMREILNQRLLNDLQRAVDERQLMVYYQPKYNIQCDPPKLSSAEALIRWKHPELGMISPGDFIPLFESNGQISTVDNYVWVKMDMKFIRNIEHNEKDFRLVELVLDIARYLRVPVVAEGVETETQMNMLKDAGCELVQGYYFSRPLPTEEFEKLIEREIKIDRGNHA